MTAACRARADRRRDVDKQRRLRHRVDASNQLTGPGRVDAAPGADPTAVPMVMSGSHHTWRWSCGWLRSAGAWERAGNDLAR